MSYRTYDGAWTDADEIVDDSIAAMDAGELSEPINAEIDHYLELLADELDWQAEREDPATLRDDNPHPFAGAFWYAYEMALDEKRKGKPYDPLRFLRVPRTFYDGDLHDAYAQGHEPLT